MTDRDKKKIILFYDDLEIKSQVIGKLNGNEFNLIDVSDFEQLVAQKSNADLVILDHKIQGIENLKNQDNSKTVPFLFIAKNENDINKDQLLKEGEDFVTLPLNEDELVSKANALLRRADILKQFGTKQPSNNDFLKEANKVLLVEDDLLLIKLFEYNLAKAGFEVKTANNGIEGLQAARDFQPDIIVSDIMMPEMDGFEFRKNLLNDNQLKSIPFVFLTAKGDEQDILEGYELEIEDYIIKTSGPRIVIAKVSAILKSLDKERKKMVSEINQAADSLRAKVVPESNPVFEGFEIKFWHQPYKGIPGGDFIDFINLDEDNLAVVLGDVMGKKWGAWYFAFAYAGYVRSAIRVALQTTGELTPSKLLQKVNESIYQDAKVSEVFATLSIITVNKKTKIAKYAGAGDLPIIYKNSQNGAVENRQSEGLLLGFSFDGGYEDVTIDLNSGDLVFLITDGISESRNPQGEQFGTEKLNKVISEINAGEDPLQKLQNEFTNFTGGNFEDDISLITIKMN